MESYRTIDPASRGRVRTRARGSLWPHAGERITAGTALLDMIGQNHCGRRCAAGDAR